MHERYYVELAKQEKLLSRKNEKSDFYNGVFDRYVNPVLTRDMIPLTWRYDLNEETNPFFMERLGINAVMNSGAIYLNGKYYLVARIEGNDRFVCSRCSSRNCPHKRFKALGASGKLKDPSFPAAEKCRAASGICGWKVCILYPSDG